MSYLASACHGSGKCFDAPFLLHLLNFYYFAFTLLCLIVGGGSN